MRRPPPLACRPIEGGMLVQEADVLPDPESEWKVVTRRSPTDSLLADLRFGWAIVRHVKSNAIVLAKDAVARRLRRGADEPRRFGRDRHPEGGRAGRRARSSPPTPSFPSPTRSTEPPPPASPPSFSPAAA